MNNKYSSRSIFGIFLVIVIMIFSLASTTYSPKLVGPERIYVDADATGSNNGTSWTDAFTHLQDAFDQTESEEFYPYEIWVAEGIYYPDEESIGSEHTNNSQSESFTFNYDYVKLYGGFAGIESSLIERDWEANLTILSGDIDQNDSNVDGNKIAEDWMDIAGSNAYHVIMLDGTTFDDITSATVIDGFVITAGDASSISHYGGGIYCFADGASADCHPELRNLQVIGNHSFIGGGIMLYANFGGKSNPKMTNISIIGNRSSDNGGGMYVFIANDQGSEGSPTLVNVRFHHNSSGDDGGGFGLTAHLGTGNPTFSNVEFCSNVAAGDGGGLSIMASTSGTVLPVLTNLSLFGNQAYRGGGIKTYQIVGSTFEMDIVNTIVWGNVITDEWPEISEIYNYGSSPLISYSDFKDCGGSGSGWDSLFCGTDNGDNIDADPLFWDAYECNLGLKTGSPAINNGDQTALPLDVTDLDRDGNFAETLPDDLAFNPRVEGNEVDMGVYEFIPSEMDKVGFYDPATGIWRMRSGNTWSDSVSYLQWGVPGWIPVVGDWDDDGEDEAGLYDPATKIWRLKSANTWDAPVTYLVWGPDGGGWTPVAGDWDNDGTEEVGFFDPTTKIWRLKSANTWNASVTYLEWGPDGGGWTPIVGDWDNDGIDEVGFYDPATKIWRLKSANTWDASVTYLVWGPEGGGWTPVAGDWDNDGVDEVGFYDPATKIWRLKAANTWDASVTYLVWGVDGGGWTPVAGDWE